MASRIYADFHRKSPFLSLIMQRAQNAESAFLTAQWTIKKRALDENQYNDEGFSLPCAWKRLALKAPVFY
jgi:hypothetical protein